MAALVVIDKVAVGHECQLLAVAVVQVWWRNHFVRNEVRQELSTCRWDTTAADHHALLVHKHAAMRQERQALQLLDHAQRPTLLAVDRTRTHAVKN